MFTGLIEAVGRVVRAERSEAGQRLRVDAPIASECRAGDSVAVNGVCLTVVGADAQAFEADVSPETLRVTSLGQMREGRLVNLERPLRADGRLGGHFVLGHVDGVGRLVALCPDGDCHWLEVELPAGLAPLAVLKGSLAIDGISLTVAALEGRLVSVQIVPFTYAHTALAAAQPGDAMNLEMDVIAKHVARLLSARDAPVEPAREGR